ncbi:MAG TPA: hemolysin family protein [Stellaceae bacterium]|jgi:putative hemolysin|nr:hemolysin family protein [Stellaceae bacterium]
MLTLQIAILLLLVLLNALFTMAEMALVSARKARLQNLAERGHEGARIALELKRDPSRFLSTMQIGITVIAILAGSFGGATLGESLATYLETMPGLVGRYAHAISIGGVVIAISYFSLIIGELVPKRIALSRPELIAAKMARLMRGFSAAMAPAAWLLSTSTDLVLRLLPLHHGEQAPVTEEEINLMLREGAAAGHFHLGETAIAQMALRLGDRRISAVMTPRTKVEWLNLADSEAENKEKIVASQHSRFPVIDGDPAVVAGVVQVKDLLIAELAGKPYNLRAALRPPLYLPNTVTALRALEMLKKSGEPMALVVDEYGDFEGIVTLTDIMEALVGDIANPGEEEDPPVVRRDDGSWLIDGMVPVDEIKDVIGLKHLPGEESGDFQTLGGFMMAQVNRVPRVADHFIVDGYRFEVVDMDGRRVDRVLIVPPKTAPAHSAR